MQDLVVSSGEDADCNQLNVPLLLQQKLNSEEKSVLDVYGFSCLT